MASVQMVDGKLAIAVYLLDNSKKTMLVEDGTTVDFVCQEMARMIGFAEYEAVYTCFALHECWDGVTIESPLSPTASLSTLVARWPKGAKFVYQIKLYMDTIKHSTDPRMIYMQYIQGVYNIICGVYPTSMDESISLAALQVQEKYGDFRPEVHKPGYLDHQLKGLIPAYLLPRKSPSQWQEEIFSRHALLNHDARTKPQLLYCRMLMARDYYGCAFFLVKQSFSRTLPADILMGISVDGIFLIHPTEKRTIERYRLNEIYRWGFKQHQTVYFELNQGGGRGPTYTFSTVVGHQISDLLTAYATEVFKEISRLKEQSARAQEIDKAVAVVERYESAKSAAGGGGGGGAETAPNKAMTDEQAALRVQAYFRGFRIRRDLTEAYAVTKIQALVKGYLARCEFDRIIAQLEEDLV